MEPKPRTTGLFGFATPTGARMDDQRLDDTPTPPHRLRRRTFAVVLAVWLVAYAAVALGLVLLAVQVQTTSGLLADPDTRSWWEWLQRAAIMSAALAVPVSVLLVAAAVRAGLR